MKSKGARLTTEISLPGRFLVYVPNGEGSGVSRRLEDAERTGSRTSSRSSIPKGGGIIVRTAAEGASAEDIERDLVFLQRLWKTIQTKAKSADRAGARLRGGRAAAAHRARPLRRRLRRRADRRRPHAPPDRQLPEEDVAAHDRARPSLPREGAALRGVRRGRTRSARRSTAASISPPAATSSSTTPRRSPSSTSTPAASSAPAGRARRAPRGHDRQEQPRGREGGRPPAPAPRHRRDHRHRLHRHGEPEEPGDGRGSAAQRARARPDEDVRGRDLPARARRDDAAERDGRPARDPHEPLPRLRRATASSSPTRRTRSRSSASSARSRRARACRRSRSRCIRVS